MGVDVLQLFSSIRAKYLARYDNNVFYSKFREDFKNVTLGTTFCPEKVKDTDKSLEYLKIMIEELGIKDIRIGLRWNRIQPTKNSEMSFDYYKPFLDYLFSKDIRVCLSIGPTKTPRWPETHIPDWVLNGINCPVDGCELGTENDLSKRALDYFSELVPEIKKIIPKKSLENISFQIENEGYNKFGKHKWYFTLDYIAECVRILNQSFPNNRILFSTSGSRKAKKIFDTIEFTGLDSNRFILSLNYYYQYDKNYGSGLMFLVDDFVRMGKWSLNRIKNYSYNNNIKMEIGEAQMEPWKRNTEPGNSVRSLRYVLLRCLAAKPAKQENFLIRLWGIEKLMQKYTNNEMTVEHNRMIELIKRINKN